MIVSVAAGGRAGGGGAGGPGEGGEDAVPVPAHHHSSGQPRPRGHCQAAVQVSEGVVRSGNNLLCF